jgi:hypothetical protein
LISNGTDISDLQLANDNSPVISAHADRTDVSPLAQNAFPPILTNRELASNVAEREICSQQNRTHQSFQERRERQLI